MFPTPLDHERVMEDYKTRLKQAEEARLLRIAEAQYPSATSRLMLKLANILIAVGTRLREFSCPEPCEPVSEPSRV